MEKSHDIKNESIKDMNIIEYIKFIRNKYYPNIDISYMESFMNMYKDNIEEFCISSDELASAGILSIRKDKKTLQSSDIIELFNRNNIIENEHF